MVSKAVTQQHHDVSAVILLTIETRRHIESSERTSYVPKVTQLHSNPDMSESRTHAHAMGDLTEGSTTLRGPSWRR